MAPSSSLSPSDALLHSITNPSLATPDLPSRLARLLGLPAPPPSSSLPPPSKPTSRTTAKAAPPPLSRSTKTKAAPAVEAEPLKDSEGCKLAMKVVNGSLQTLTSLAQTQWDPATTAKPAAPAKDVNPFASPPPTLQNVLAVVACAHLALKKLRARREEGGKADLAVERAGVSLVARCNAVGLIEASLAFLSHSHPHLLTLYEHDPLPSPPATTTTIKKKAAPVRATSSTTSSSRATASTSKFQPSTKGFDSSLRLLCLPSPTEELEDPVAGVLVGWALGAVVAVGKSLSAKEDGLEHLLSTLLSPPSAHSFALTHLHLLPSTSLPPILLPAIRLLSNPPSPSPSPSTSPRTLFDLRSISLDLLLRLPSLQPKLLWEQALRSCQIFLRAGQGTKEFEVVNEQLGRLVERVEGKEGESLVEGKDWIKVAELWIKIATKLDDLPTLEKVTRLLDLPPSTPARKASNSKSTTTPAPAVEETELDSEVVVARTTAALMQASTSIELYLGRGSKSTASSTKISTDLMNVSSRLASFSHSLSRLDSPSEVSDRLIKMFKAMEKTRRSCLALVVGREGGPVVSRELEERAREVLQEWVGLVERLEVEVQADPSSSTANVLANLCTSSIDTLLALCRIDCPSSPPFKTPSPGFPHLQRAITLRLKFKEVLVSPSPNSDSDASPSPSSMAIDFANLARCISGSAYNCAGTIYKSAGAGTEAVEFLVMACEVGREALKEVGTGTGTGAEGEQDEIWKALREGLSKRWELLGSCYSKSGEKERAHTSLISAILALPSSTFQLLSTLASKSSLSEVFVHPDLIHLAALVVRVTLVAVSDLSLPPTEVSLLSELNSVGMDPGAMGAILEHQIIALEGSSSREASEASLKLIEDALGVYEEQEFPVRRIRLLARAVQQSCLQPFSGSALHVSVEREVVALFERQSFALDAHLISFLPQYRGLSHLWLAVEAHCFSSGSSSQPLLRHASESAKSFRSALSVGTEVEAVSKGAKSPLVVTNRQPKERVQRRPVRGAAVAATPAVVKRGAVKATPAAKVVKSSVVAAVPDATLSSSTSSSKIASRFDDLGQFLSHLDSFASLLGLLGHSLARIEQLKIIRSLTRADPSRIEVFLSASASLGAEYVKLSKSSRAAGTFTSTSIILGKASVDSVSPASRADFLLRYSDFLAHEGKVDQSITIYQEALEQSNQIVDVVTSRSAAKIRERSLRLERAAVALMVAASIHRARDDFPSSVASLSQSHRLWTRAIGNVSRLSPTIPEDTPPLKVVVSNPFEVAKATAPEDAISADDLTAKSASSTTTPKGRRFDGMMWRTSRGLLDCLFALSETSSRRGTARETEFFLQEALELARSVNSTVLASRALAGRGLLSLLLGKEDECDGFVLQGRSAGDTIGERNVAELAALEGQLHLRSRRHLDALESFEIGIAALRAFDAASEIEELRLPSSRASVGESGGSEPVLLPLLAQLLRCKASILRETASFDPSSLRSVQDQLAKLPSTAETRSDDHSYNATVALRLALDEFKADLTMSSLTESTISMPMGSSSGSSTALSKARKEVKATLARAESAFDKTLASDAACGRVQRIREACMSLSLLRAFQTSLGQSSSTLTSKTAWALDHSSAITLSRELVEIVASKFRDSAPDDLVWPDLEEPSSSTTPLLPNGDSSFRHSSMRSYWSSVRERHLSEAIYSTKGTTEMPPNWSVVTINVTDDQSTLFISRHRHGSEPLVFCLPLDRQGRRDGDDETFTFLNAKEELEEIISKSNDGAKNAKGVEGKEGRAAWWAERRDLDKRMEELLSNIEFCWLGAFKTILNRPSSHSPESFSLFRSKMEKLFTRVLSSDQDRRKLLKIHLDDNLLECFSSLSPLCRDEELEDLVYFVLDLYQVHGVPVALAEIDIDELVTDLRGVLEDSERDRPKSSSDDEDEHHTFLILDRHVQSIPWESLPSLRGRSISRIPSLAFLADRLALSNHLLSPSSPSLSSAFSKMDVSSLSPSLSPFDTSSTPTSFAFPMDVRNGFFILNPSGDLKKTQDQFEPWIKQMKEIGWDGIVGRVPSEGELIQALGSKDIVVYFGHGGGEQYIRSHKIRSLPRCATLMLWGCSSGALRDFGEFDRAGTPWNYMLAGCPSLVANLWDVTDRDIDRLSEAVFLDLDIQAGSIRAAANGKASGKKKKGKTTARAVGEARDKCKLRFLTGAAVVVYGVPVRFV